MATTKTIKLSELKDSPFNPRRSLGDLGEMTASIKKRGVLQNLVVRKSPDGDGYETISGHRRKAAAKKAGLKEVPALVVDASDTEVQELQIIENLEREDLNPMEEAEAYGRLQNEFGYPVEKIAEAVERTPAVIYARLKLLELLPAGRKALTDGDLTPSTALLVARFKGERMQAAALSLVAVRNRWGDPMQAREAAAKLKQLQASEDAAVRRENTRAASERTLKMMHRRIRGYALGRIVEVIERRQDLQPNDLRMVIAAITDGGVPEALLERRGYETPKQLISAAQKMSGAELRGLLVEAALTSWVDEDADDAHHRLKATCKAFSLDFRDIERTVRELQLKEEQKAEADSLFKK